MRGSVVGHAAVGGCAGLSLAATLVDNAPQLLHGWYGAEPPFGQLLHGEAPSGSRLPLR